MNMDFFENETTDIVEEVKPVKEEVLVILKPDAMDKKLLSVIKKDIKNLNLRVIASKYITPTEEKLAEHYAHIQDTPFFDGVLDFMLCNHHKCNQLHIMVVEGVDAVNKIRTLAGATNPEEAEPNSLRGRFGNVTEDRFENVIHASSSVEDGKREKQIWFGGK
jgi:nucleoside-diphosphate kinase